MKSVMATISNPRYRKPVAEDVVLFTNENGTFAVTAEYGVFRKSRDEAEITAVIEGDSFVYTEEPLYVTGKKEGDIKRFFEEN